MKSFYKSIFAFILFAMPFNCLFAQQFAVGPSFAYDFMSKGSYYDKGSGFSAGVNLFADVKKHFIFQTGLIFSRSTFYYKFPLPELPLEQKPNHATPPTGTFYYPYDANYVYKSFQIPFNVLYKFYRNHFIDIYALAGTSFKFRLNQFMHGEQYLIIDDTITDYSLSHYDSKIWANEENMFQFLSLEVAIGSNVILSNHLKAGIEFQMNYGYNDVFYNANYPSLALTGKYYFDEIKRPKK